MYMFIKEFLGWVNCGEKIHVDWAVSSRGLGFWAEQKRKAK